MPGRNYGHCWVRKFHVTSAHLGTLYQHLGQLCPATRQTQNHLSLTQHTGKLRTECKARRNPVATFPEHKRFLPHSPTFQPYSFFSWNLTNALQSSFPAFRNRRYLHFTCRDCRQTQTKHWSLLSSSQGQKWTTEVNSITPWAPWHSAFPCPSHCCFQPYLVDLALSFHSYIPVTSCHSSTMFLGGQLAYYCSSLVKGLKKDQRLISYLDQLLELGVFFWVRIYHSAFLILLCSSKRGNISEIHFKCALLKLQQCHTIKGLISWLRNGSAYSSSQPGDVQWPQCQAVLETHRWQHSPTSLNQDCLPLTFPCSSPALCRMLHENPYPDAGHIHSNTPKTTVNFSPSPQFEFKF